MALVLLQLHQQQQQRQESWFFLDLEDDWLYEVDVDMVGSCIQMLSFGCHVVMGKSIIIFS